MEQFWPRGLKSPIVFCNVVGVEGEVFDAKSDKRKVDPHSKCNKQEAEKVVSTIGIVAWYRALYLHMYAIHQRMMTSLWAAIIMMSSCTPLYMHVWYE